MSDREPPSPLARNLFAMKLPADIAALIKPQPGLEITCADR